MNKHKRCISDKELIAHIRVRFNAKRDFRPKIFPGQ